MEFSRHEYWSELVFQYSMGSSPPRGRSLSCISWIGRWILYHKRHQGTPHTYLGKCSVLILLCSLGAAQMRRKILKFSQFQDLMWFWGFLFRVKDDLSMEHTADLGIASSSSCWSCRLDLEEKLQKRWVKRTETAWNRLCGGNLFSRHWSRKASSGYSVINETWESMAYMHVIEDQCWMRSIYSNNRSKRNKR